MDPHTHTQEGEEKSAITDEESKELWSSIWSFFSGGNGGGLGAGTGLAAPNPMSSLATIMSLKAGVDDFPGTEGAEYVRALQLALWDNVCGPRVVHVWEGPSPLEEDAGSSLAQQILKDEICRELDETSLEPKVHVLPELDSIVSSVVFAALYEGSVQRFALSLVLASSALDRFLAVYQVATSRMLHLVEKLVALLKRKPAAAIPAFTHLVPDFGAGVVALHAAQLDDPVFESTLFGGPHSGGEYDHTFLAACIGAHLANHGCTVVVGTDQDQVNLFIRTLALFIRPEEQARAAELGTIPGPADVYHPDLFLQGIVVDQDDTREGSAVIPDERVIRSLRPTTLFDLRSLRIFQTHSFNEYAVLRDEYMESELALLFGMDSESRWSASDGLFRPLKDVSAMVEDLVIDVLRLPARLRYARIKEGLRSMTRRALLLIKCVESELQLNSTLSKDAVKRIRSDCGLGGKGDLDVGLGVAERFRPGTYKDVLGDPAFVEDQLKLLLESFL